MKRRNDLGAVGVEILLVPVIVIAALLYVSSSKVEPIEPAPVPDRPIVKYKC